MTSKDSSKFSRSTGTLASLNKLISWKGDEHIFVVKLLEWVFAWVGVTPVGDVQGLQSNELQWLSIDSLGKNVSLSISVFWS